MADQDQYDARIHRAQSLGWRAGRAGVPLTSNPYPDDDRLSPAWRDFWKIGRAETSRVRRTMEKVAEFAHRIWYGARS